MKKKNTRNPRGGGTIRKRADGRWEGRYTTGFDPKTGKQIQKSVYGKTQKEVRQRLTAFTAEIDDGTYREPCKMTVGQWLDIWLEDYQLGVKASTAFLYQRQVETYLKPTLGKIRLDHLEAHTIQKLYNNLAKPRGDKPPLSAKSIKNIHGILHKALKQAVQLNYIRYNPTDACNLPKVFKKEIRPLEDQQTARFLDAIRGHQYEIPFQVALFTGMREGELLGLKWECVNFEKGTILIDKQLRRHQQKNGGYYFSPPKNNKSRVLHPAPYVMQLLRRQKALQAEQQLAAGPAWEGSGTVFTNEMGRFVSYRALYDSFKRVVRNLGYPDVRFHDLRHTYAVNSLRAGDDVKTVQSNLGHANASFTLDIYGHFTEDMKLASSQRMENFIATAFNL